MKRKSHFKIPSKFYGCGQFSIPGSCISIKSS